MKITRKAGKAWVTFAFTPREAVEKVEVLGEWNDWEPEAMKQKKSGEYYLTKILPEGGSYQFGYRIDDQQWHIDQEMPRCASPFGSENAVLEL